jgi:hypothetical protein
MTPKLSGRTFPYHFLNEEFTRLILQSAESHLRYMGRCDGTIRIGRTLVV